MAEESPSAPAPSSDPPPALAAPVGDAAGRAGARLSESVATRLSATDGDDPGHLQLGPLAHQAFGPLADELKQLVGGDLGPAALAQLQQSLDVVGDVLSPSLQDPEAALDRARAALAGQPGVDPAAIAAMPDLRADAAPPRGPAADA